MVRKLDTSKQTAAPAKKAAPRVKAAKHRAVTPIEVEGSDEPRQDAHARVAKIAYGYWESRGYQGGDPVEDWLRAENELTKIASIS